jgi:hypothetical protein
VKAGHLWLTPVIPATQEAEIRRIVVRSQPRANSSRDPISKKPITKKQRWGWWSVVPEFKFPYNPTPPKFEKLK